MRVCQKIGTVGLGRTQKDLTDHSDVDWEDYTEWVRNGGGDEWFQEE